MMSLSSISAGYRRIFYLVSPNETSFKYVEDVPGYVEQAFPFFVSLILIESVILFIQGRELPRANDGMNSLSAGLLSLLHSLVFRPVELSAFVWVHRHLNIVTLPWDSPWTWVLGLTGVDFAYYWVHRFGHEVNIVWAAHQTHHSSEDYNLTTALRQSAFQKYFSWVFYLPLGLVLPPSVFLVHLHLNLLYQFWVHTEVVRSLGPLEYILSTPSHHRVHHGRNPYCIDKNYGGVLIIWDRIFGTFEAERQDEKLAYGLVHSLNSWSPLYAQFCQLLHILRTIPRMEGVADKLAVFWKGPGWSPGKPRLGLPQDIPQVTFPFEKYNASIGLWRTLYVWSHFAVCVVFYLILTSNVFSLSPCIIYMGVVLIVTSLTSFGAIYDNRWYAGVLECSRCCAILVYLVVGVRSYLTEYPPLSFHGLLAVYSLSLSVWGVAVLGRDTIRPRVYLDQLICKLNKKHL